MSLGHQGHLLGEDWTVIGYIEKRVESKIYAWSEYLIVNDKKDFCWLLEEDGHWVFFKPMNKGFKENIMGREVVYNYNTYHLFQKNSAETYHMVGEFNWNLRPGVFTQLWDYVRPPFVLSLDKESHFRSDWFYGQYLDSSEIKKAFQLSGPLPAKKGIYPCQYPFFLRDKTFLLKGLIFFVSLLFILQIVALQGSNKKIILEQSYDKTGEALSTETFLLEGGLKNVEVEAAADLSNDWLDIQGDLVNIVTGEKYEFDTGTEYYYGMDGSYYWDEGSKKNSTLLSSVPNGKYQIIFNSAQGNIFPKQYTLTVRRNIPSWSNFLWASFLMSIIPLAVFCWSHIFENRRWSNSDFFGQELG